ncbi:tRNA (cytidine(32)/uridine(32)-2'-O)-methyltransferase [hydrothermal vent metagenome]|uniref:tRNA (Cytidine(32)/uridine(32)-2'-O)-methyltransferase n=1 Tax=hydrothermal vent metagenome TaxID=652676 RepID=A0A3B1A0K2_9ZZZZ
MLNRVRIVLVDTSHPGNIGAVARAMKNMCLSQLYLVQPQQFPHAEATARASGADDLLASAVVCDSLPEALAGCGLVVGASARLRHLKLPQWDPRQCAERVVDEARQRDVAIIFGRENSGLTNEELALCHYLLHIPSNPDYSSLNIAAAVQVVAYELMMASGAPSVAVVEGESESSASADEMERFYAHLRETLVDIGFLNPDNPRVMMRRLRRLFNRARPNQVEMNILRGILTASQKPRSRQK